MVFNILKKPCHIINNINKLSPEQPGESHTTIVKLVCFVQDCSSPIMGSQLCCFSVEGGKYVDTSCTNSSVQLSLEPNNKTDLYTDSSSPSEDKELLNKYYVNEYSSPQLQSLMVCRDEKITYHSDSNLEESCGFEQDQVSLASPVSAPVIEDNNTTENQYYHGDEYEEASVVDPELELMKAMGLPVAFGKVSSVYTSKSYSKNRQKGKKVQSFSSSCQRILAAFNLMKIEFNPDGLLFGGTVQYKMKKIADQNLKLHFGSSKNKHIYFDDDGDVYDCFDEASDSEEYQVHEDETIESENIPVSESNKAQDSSCDDTALNEARSRKINKTLYISDIRPKQHIFFDDEGNPIQSSGETTNVVPNEQCQRKRSHSLDTDVIDDTLKIKTRKCELGEKNSDTASAFVKAETIQEGPLKLTAATDSQLPDSDVKELSGQLSNFKKQKTKDMDLIIQQNPKLRKYWYKRFSLFSKFNEGIQLDEESWYSVTPERIAKYTAERCKCETIVDGFCGAGGNAIQFAFTCKKVIAIDIDPKKIELAKNNAKVYGVEDKIEFIVGDFFNLAGTLTADVVFLSPPWGGPSYLHNNDWYNLNTQLQPQPISILIETARNISQNIAIFLPRNSDIIPLLLEVVDGDRIEIQQNIDRKKVVAITAFYNDLVAKCD